jgi:hypothetical protein
MEIVIVSCINAVNLRVKFKLISVLTTNNKRENMYCDWRGKFISFSNNSLQESQLLELVTILITLFCNLKI